MAKLFYTMLWRHQFREQVLVAPCIFDKEALWSQLKVLLDIEGPAHKTMQQWQAFWRKEHFHVDHALAVVREQSARSCTSAGHLTRSVCALQEHRRPHPPADRNRTDWWWASRSVREVGRSKHWLRISLFAKCCKLALCDRREFGIGGVMQHGPRWKKQFCSNIAAHSDNHVTNSNITNTAAAAKGG